MVGDVARRHWLNLQYVEDRMDGVVTPDSYLGNKRDIFYLNNENN